MMDFYDILLAQKLSGGGGGGGGGIQPYFHKQYNVPNTTNTAITYLEVVEIPDDLGDLLEVFFVSEYVGEVPDNHHIGNTIFAMKTEGNNVPTVIYGKVSRKEDGTLKEGGGTSAGVVLKTFSTTEWKIGYQYSSTATKALGGTYDVKMWKIPKSILQE